MKKFLPVASLLALTCAASTAQAEAVEIYLLDMLDNTQAGYCIDIAKGREEAANPDDGLQGHTCYSPGGALGYDQTFETEKFAQGLLYMTNFDVCATLDATDAGSALSLAACDGRAAQEFTFEGTGTIVPASAAEMCVTVGADTVSGRSDANQIKVLTIEPCSDELAAYQTWGVRTVSQ
ncbi:Ricin-type beta-trefoil lectin domain-containing protein [Yoonia tamlensis]|uniref:Ricin-type beta-trefoil lectin domain-containing protein n=1 Tax=Yoonia tamlensis TaxID=390270 RepID=A0A1I6GK09_9RHOB|nr:ricin-type beta-trefoil lectin domain protein [Yoonia tamlensis]SFR42518.1 Ricin-type beta-trefoil lectin domain-containing protein [Yoonia tamlensis]